MVGPRIVLERIEQPGQFGEQPLVYVLERSPSMKRLGELIAFFIEIDASENRLGASREGGKVFCDPIRRDLTIGVRCQDHAVALACFDKPRFGEIHCRAAGGAGVRDRGGQSRFDDPDVQRQLTAQISGEARTPIGAIVGEEDNTDLRGRD